MIMTQTRKSRLSADELAVLEAVRELNLGGHTTNNSQLAGRSGRSRSKVGEAAGFLQRRKLIQDTGKGAAYHWQITPSGRELLAEPAAEITTGKRFGDMTPQERQAAMHRAADRLAAELNAHADEISAVLDAEPEPQADRIERAYQSGGSAAAADAQACKSGASGTGSWRSRPHLVPADADERAAWMQGYGRVFAWWGGATSDGMTPELRRIAQDGITGNL
jgi:DNA-binding MarR family transcriptional regulator